MSTGPRINGTTWRDDLPVMRQKREVEELVGQQKDMSSYPGGQQDALRHALWMARLAQDYGQTRALLLGGLHEGIGAVGNLFEKDPQERQRVWDETKMDLYNNPHGARMGAANKDKSLDELAEIFKVYPLLSMPPRPR